MTATQFAPSAADPSAVVFGFLASVLVAVAAGVFGYYALANRRLQRLESQGAFWRYLVLVGATGGSYGLLGVAGVLGLGGGATGARLVAAFADGALLFCVAFLAFSMREVYYNSTIAPPRDEQRISLPTLRRIEGAFVVVILVEWVAVLVLDQLVVVQLVKAAGSLAFAAYGVVFAERLEGMARGTPLDTLRRHLIPVLVTLGALGAADLGVVAGVEPVVVDAVKHVFVVLVAGFLVTATIRLQQNVEGLTATE